MSRSFLLTLATSFLLTSLPVSLALADSGFSCNPTYNGTIPSCNSNPNNLSESECRTYCQNSDYCMPYQDEQQIVFSGFWRDYGTYQKLTDCQNECNRQKEQCDPTAQDCLDKYTPQNIDCSALTDVNDQEYCKLNCVDNILTSECGRSCLKQGIETASIVGCMEDLSCSNLCTGYYCASIPMDYETKWSVFGILMILLTAMSSITLVVMHKMGNTRTEDKNS